MARYYDDEHVTAHALRAILMRRRLFTLTIERYSFTSLSLPTRVRATRHAACCAPLRVYAAVDTPRLVAYRALDSTSALVATAQRADAMPREREASAALLFAAEALRA